MADSWSFYPGECDKGDTVFGESGDGDISGTDMVSPPQARVHCLRGHRSPSRDHQAVVVQPKYKSVWINHEVCKVVSLVRDFIFICPKVCHKCFVRAFGSYD